MGSSPFLPLPSTLSIDTVEQRSQTLLVSLHATSSIVPCPRCGTVGSRIHSRYHRTVADLTCGGQRVILRLLVRKWICPEPSCPQRIKAPRFTELVQRYARMTDRLMKALQSVGVTSNGADAAQIVSSLGMPTTAKTIIRRVLQLALPTEGTVRVVGIDEWAWKKGFHYGTILVDLEQRRIAALLSERSVETSTAWFKQHPEVDIVSRDRGKLFREAASAGAPQAKHIVDRFHLQKNFAEALEKFFRPKTRVLKMAARNVAGTAHPAPRARVPHKAVQERRRRHRQRVAVHRQIWKLFREGYHKEQIAQLVGISSRSVYRILERQEAPSPRRRSRSHSIVDPYLAYLTERWNQGCHSGGRLYEEIRAQGYPGSRRTLERQLLAFRPHGSHVVTKQVITLGKAPSARGTALMAVRPAHNRTKEQTVYLAHLTQSDRGVALALTLAQDFGHLLRKREGKLRLAQWQSTVRESRDRGTDRVCRRADRRCRSGRERM